MWCFPFRAFQAAIVARSALPPLGQFFFSEIDLFSQADPWYLPGRLYCHPAAFSAA
jgi:hypothetical protein